MNLEEIRKANFERNKAMTTKANILLSRKVDLFNKTNKQFNKLIQVIHENKEDLKKFKLYTVKGEISKQFQNWIIEKKIDLKEISHFYFKIDLGYSCDYLQFCFHVNTSLYYKDDILGESYGCYYYSDKVTIAKSKDGYLIDFYEYNFKNKDLTTLKKQIDLNKKITSLQDKKRLLEAEIYKIDKQIIKD